MFKPTTFGKFYLYEKLAIGGMAEIFKAKLYGIAGFEKTLVVKQILPEYANDGEFVKMFIDEANIAVSLTHGNIVPVYELGKIGDRYYIAMEYVDGENLETIIDEVAKAGLEVPVAKAVEIVIEVLKGLDYAHRKQGPGGQSLGIVHRDISPQNVMVSFDGEVKIVDFGIAKAASKLSLTRVGTLKGKFGYMSPEQAAGSEVDRRTDVYAAGIVLWELLIGKRLYDAENDVDLLRKVRAGQVPSPRSLHARVPEALDRLVLRALARNPAERYQEASQLQLDLQRWLYSRPEDPTEDSLANWMRRLFRREVQGARPLPPLPAPPPPPPPSPPAPAAEPRPDAAVKSRREVSYARNSEVLRLLEQAEQAARTFQPPGGEPTTTSEPSRDTTNETLEALDLGDDTRSQSISGDFLAAPTTTGPPPPPPPGAGAPPAVAEDFTIDWDETTDRNVRRRAEGEFIERALDDGPIIRVPIQGRRREVPAPWQAGAIPRDDEETRPPGSERSRKMPVAPPPPPPPGPAIVPGIGDITGDTAKPTSSAEPPLFAPPKKSRVPAFAALALFAAAAILGAVAAVASGGLQGTPAATATPTPTITSMAEATRTRTTPSEPSPAGTRVTAAPTERRASFDTIPPGANVYLGSRFLGKTPLPSVEVPTGELAIRYTKPGYRELKASYPAGAEALKASERLDAMPVATAPPPMGRISVQSTPWGEVSIDGVKVKNTPLLNHAIRAGTHKVTVFCPTLKKSETRTIVVRPNEDHEPLIFNFD